MFAFLPFYYGADKETAIAPAGHFFSFHSFEPLLIARAIDTDYKPSIANQRTGIFAFLVFRYRLQIYAQNTVYRPCGDSICSSLANRRPRRELLGREESMLDKGYQGSRTFPHLQTRLAEEYMC